MRSGRTPENRFTFVGLLPSAQPVVERSALATEVIDRLRAVEADERRKASNEATPLATRTRHEGVATGISIALAAIEASDRQQRATEASSRSKLRTP